MKGDRRFGRASGNQRAAPADGASPADGGAPIVVLTDVALVARARAGDGQAFGALVERYQDRVFNTCLRICGSSADAADLTQSAFIKAFETLPGFESRSSFFTWLFRIAVNLALSHGRRRRRAALSLDALGDAAGDVARPQREAADPARRLIDAELREQIEWALEQLDDEFRAAVVLKDVEDLDYAAIAEVLDVPIGTVKSRISRGRATLRELLVAREADRGRLGA